MTSCQQLELQRLLLNAKLTCKGPRPELQQEELNLLPNSANVIIRSGIMLRDCGAGWAITHPIFRNHQFFSISCQFFAI